MDPPGETYEALCVGERTPSGRRGHFHQLTRNDQHHACCVRHSVDQIKNTRIELQAVCRSVITGPLTIETTPFNWVGGQRDQRVGYCLPMLAAQYTMVSPGVMDIQRSREAFARNTTVVPLNRFP